MFRSQEDHISVLAKRFADIDHARKEAEAKSKVMEEENANLRILNQTATRALSEASVLNHNEALKAKAFETSHKSLLERIERDTARIKELTNEVSAAYVELNNQKERGSDVWITRYHNERVVSANLNLKIKQLEIAAENSKGLVKRLQERLSASFSNWLEEKNKPESDKIDEFRKVVRMLRERGDRWKERATSMRERVKQLIHERFMLREENTRLKADLTKALDSRTVQRPMKFPGC